MNKKIFLGTLSTLVAVATPVATAVSCATKNDSIILNVNFEEIIKNVIEKMKKVKKTDYGYDSTDDKFVNPTYFLISEVLRSSFKSLGETSYPMQKIFDKLVNPVKGESYDHFYQLANEIVDGIILGDILGIKTGNETKQDVITAIESKIQDEKTISDTIDQLINNAITLTLTDVLRGSGIVNSDLSRIIQNFNGKKLSINLNISGKTLKNMTLPKEDGKKINLDNIIEKTNAMLGNNDNVDFKAVISFIKSYILNSIKGSEINSLLENTIDTWKKRNNTLWDLLFTTIKKIKKAEFLDESSISILYNLAKKQIPQDLIDEFIKIYKK